MDDPPSKIVNGVQTVQTEKFSVLEKRAYKLYEVDIDFDAAHDAWTKNKIKGKNGTYRYRKRPVA